MGNRTAQMRTVDGQRAVDATVAFANAVADQIPPMTEAEIDASNAEIQRQIADGDKEADAFADAVAGVLEAEATVPTTFASMLVDMGKSLIQLHEERVKLDKKLWGDLWKIEQEADKQRDEARRAHREAATELGVRLQGVAKAMGA